MPYWASELINLVLRWVHVVAAILWIGQTALFTWLETRLRVEADERGREVWMVHGGGFYRLEKLDWQAPPKALHWFKWESMLTLVSGATLFVWIYWIGGILLPPDTEISGLVAIGLSVAAFVVSWLVYDRLWASPLGRRPRVAAAVGFVLLVGIAWGLGRVFTGRAAFLQVGAVLGTIMVLNVWERILPAMRAAVAAAGEGRELGASLRAQTAEAAERSRHNTFMAFPVVFLMLSTHYPVTTYGHRHGWAMLAAGVLAGAGARWLLNRHEARPAGGGRPPADGGTTR